MAANNNEANYQTFEIYVSLLVFQELAWIPEKIIKFLEFWQNAKTELANWFEAAKFYVRFQEVSVHQDWL